ncbi:response regulator transcription factor [Colwellia sp. D2M02]|uniref:Response regulator transcription factor n=1 Tax=Colwellia asteriadis TaxID=517723 RepID=A0ABN1L459_9GAMM|nr:response regulator transcription factor [Colwellia sp. D2M02]MBU2894607.1 response regulator transcription factor [Colwellia sp. D2M02]
MENSELSTNNTASEYITSVLLVDDHPMVQDGLTACLSYYHDINIIGSTQDGKDALTQALTLKPDVILMDISMPDMNGIDATEIITEQLKNTRVLIFSMHDSIEFVSSAMQAGASGYILKDTGSAEVYAAIKAVASGEKYFSPSIAQALIDSPLGDEKEKLTTREQVILAYTAQGYACKTIAKMLNISFRTVEAHRRNIKAKLNVDSLAELIRYAVNHGLVDSE